MIMLLVLLAALSLLAGLFVLINIYSASVSLIFFAELIVLLLMAVLFLAALGSAKNMARSRFLLYMFFLCGLANAVFLYLVTVRSVTVLFIGALSLAGFFLNLPWKKRVEAKAKTRSKKAEVAKQLGPEDEKPKVVVIKKRRRKRAKRR